MTTLKQVREAISHHADSVGKLKNGNIMVRRGFFYTNGCTAEKFHDVVLKLVPGSLAVNFGVAWKPFRGGATVAQCSHFWVELKV